jgi:hypothetical protein
MVFILNTQPILDHLTDDSAYGFIMLHDPSNSLQMKLKGEMHKLEQLLDMVPTITSRFSGKEIPCIESWGLRYDKNGNVNTYTIIK